MNARLMPNDSHYPLLLLLLLLPQLQWLTPCCMLDRFTEQPAATWSSYRTAADLDGARL